MWKPPLKNPLRHFVCLRWQTLIEAHVDVKTTDGYVVRMRLGDADEIGSTVNPRMNQPQTAINGCFIGTISVISVTFY